MKLISLKDFVLGKQEEIHEDWEQNYKADNVSYSEFMVERFIEYAAFLNQPLTLGMFVPCDENGSVLKQETVYCMANEGSNAFLKHKKYWEAKEKVLFEGFVKSQDFEDRTVENKDLNIHVNLADFSTLTISTSLGLGYAEVKTVEDLINCEIKLTESALKQIGIKE